MGLINNLLQKIKANTLDKTDLDEKIVSGVSNFFGGAKNTINTAGQNLNAWKQVATQPQVRDSYISNVIKPKLPTYSETNPSPAAKLQRRLEAIKTSSAPVINKVKTVGSNMLNEFNRQQESLYGDTSGSFSNQLKTSLPGQGISAIKTGINNMTEGVKMISNPTTAYEYTKELDPVRQFLLQRGAAPIAQVPYNIKETFAGDKKPLLMRGIHALSAVGGLLPGVDDLIMAGIDYGKGVAKNTRLGIKGTNRFFNKDAVESLTGQQPVGLGDAAFNDPTLQTIGNFAELPLVMGLFGGKKAKGFDDIKGGKFANMSDKMTRFEINDSNVKTLIPHATDGFNLKLKQIMSHDELFKNYPELADMPVSSALLKNNAVGLFDGKQIILDKNFLKHPTAYETGKIIAPDGSSVDLKFSKYTTSSSKIKATLLHEVQHAIQNIEGFAVGGTPEGYFDYVQRGVQATKKQLSDQMNTIAPAYSRYVEKLNSGVMPKEEFYNSPVVQKYNQIRKQYESLILKGYGADAEIKNDYYKNLAGEVEARDVAARMDLTPEQRAKIAPGSSQGIPVKDQIVDFASGNTLSQLKSPIEQDKNLIAMHNIRPESLLHADELGGLPVPSIAISRKEYPLENFGDISLIGSKDLIDPSVKGNKVFNSDAYSKRYPQVVYTPGKNASQYMENLSNEVKNAGGELRTSADSWLEDFRNRGKSGISDSTNTHRAFYALNGGKESGITDIWDFANQNKQAYDNFVNTITENIKGTEQIFKGFTPSGYRKYVDHNLDNVVKEMTGKVKDTEGFNYGVGSIRASGSKQFRTLDQIKSERNKIISSADAETMKNDFETRLNDILDKYKVPWDQTDEFLSIAKDFINGKISPNELKEYRATKDITDLNDFAKFANDLKNAPTEYFEAKPQRAVGLNEFKAAVIPKGTSQDILDILNKRGVKYYTYDPEITGDRAKVIKSVSDEGGLSFNKANKLPTKDVIQTVYDALNSGDKEGAKALYDEFSKEFKMPTFEKMMDKVDLESPQSRAAALRSKAEMMQTDATGRAQVASEQRAPFNSQSIGRAKQIVNSRTYQEGDLESVRNKLDPEKQAIISDMVESVRNYLDDPQMTEKDAIEYLANLPNKTETILKRNPEIKSMNKKADELDRGLDIVRDEKGNVVSVSATQIPKNTNEKLAAEKAAKADFDQWQKTMWQQEGATLTPKGMATKNLNKVVGDIKKNTISPLASKVDEMNDITGFSGQARDLYRNFKSAFGKNYETAKKMILDPFDKAKGSFIDDQKKWLSDLDQNIVQKLGIKKGSAESAAVQDFGEGNRDLASLVKEFGQEKANNIVNADKWFRQAYNNLLGEVNKARAVIYPNNPEKQIPFRKDYYRHFTEMAEGFQGLKNIFETPAGISSKLSGISPNTKPKSKWLSFAQKRLGVKTDIDAVGGFLNYIGASSYAKNIDPQISQFRNLASELANVTDDASPNAGKVNNFIEYLNDFANDLSGKTNEVDRWFQKVIPGGRKTFKAINWLNNRVKANTILGNISSSISQISNVPQGIADAGVKNSLPAIGDSLASIFKENKPMTQSNFLKERYFNDFNKFDTSILDKTKDFAAWMVGALDEVGTKFIWNAEYRKGLGDNVADAVKFADDRTRSLVAGRGVGEVPLLQKSKMFQLVAPFQLEVGNLWYVMKDWVDEKQFGKLAKFAVGAYVMNKAQEAIRGSGTVIDPIQAMVDSYKAYSEEDDKKKGLIKAGGRVAGEVLSNVPLGQTVAGMYPEYGTTIGDTKLPTRKELFGRNDPTRFGSGLIAAQGVTDPLYKLLPPFGGNQIKKTIQGIDTVNKGYKETASGRVSDVVDKTAMNYVKGALFGKSSVKGVNAEGSSFGEKQSQLIKSTAGAKETAQSFLMTREKQAQLDKARAKVKDSSGGVQTVGNDIVYNDGGEVKTIYIDRISSMPSGTAYEKAKKQGAAYKVIDDLMNVQDMTDTDREKIITEKLGLDPKEASYYIVANDTEMSKTGYVKDVLGNSKKEEMLSNLVSLRKTVNDKRILSDGVIDNLVEEGIITKADGKSLKAIKYTKEKGYYDSSLGSKSNKTMKSILAKLKSISDDKTTLNKKLAEMSNSSTKYSSNSLRDVLLKRRSSISTTSDTQNSLLSNIKKKTQITSLKKD